MKRSVLNLLPQVKVKSVSQVPEISVSTVTKTSEVDKKEAQNRPKPKAPAPKPAAPAALKQQPSQTQKKLDSTANAAWESKKERFPELPLEEKLAFASSFVFCDTPSIKAARTLLKLTWDTKGPSEHTNDLANKIISLIKKHYHLDQYVNLLILRASIRAHASNYVGTVTDVMTAIENGKERAIYRGGSLHLLRMMYKMGHLKNDHTQLAFEAFQQTIKNENSFFEAISDPTKTIAVVGNSPLEIGKGRGAFIDSHDIVIRFNNFETSAAYREDFGSKTTTWLRAGSHRDIWRRPSSPFEHIVFSGPDRRFHATPADDVAEMSLEDGNISFVPSRIYSQLVQDLQFPPSAGLLVLYWLKTVRGPLKDNNVNHFGFSMNDQNPNTSSHYYPNAIRKQTYSHNWEAEAAYMETLVS